MGPVLALAYGAAAYVVFLGAFLYAIGFVGDFIVPKTINTGPPSPMGEALAINMALLGLFAIQHSGMARRSFKQWLLRYAPASVERSTYVLLASLILILLFWRWRPMPEIVWAASDPSVAVLLTALSLAGWLIVLLSTFLINHFELFGLSQTIRNLRGRDMDAPRFRTPLFYKFVRHPIYLGFIIAFWATPTMTIGHLLFAAATTAYIFIGIALEERDLVATFGDEYRRYRERVGMLLPLARGRAAPATGDGKRPV